MTDEQKDDAKQGPANPQAAGVEAPTPPRGPQRQDEPEGDLSEGHDDDVSGSATANKHASESGGGTIPLEDEQPGPSDSGQDSGEALQEENAGTSQDQPSGAASEG